MTITIQWDSNYSVGNAVLDRQHQKLLGLSNELEECVTADRQMAFFRFHGILHELAQYAREHFRTEEEMLRRCAWSDLASHMRDHEAFEQQIADWSFAATMGTLNIGEVQRYIAQWWKHHILESDMQYKGLLNGKRK